MPRGPHAMTIHGLTSLRHSPANGHTNIRIFSVRGHVVWSSTNGSACFSIHIMSCRISSDSNHLECSYWWQSGFNVTIYIIFFFGLMGLMNIACANVLRSNSKVGTKKDDFCRHLFSCRQITSDLVEMRLFVIRNESHLLHRTPTGS